MWECSHVGGDRFAANVLVLPDGLMYGYVDEAAAERLVDHRAEGRLLTEHLRGQCGSPPAAQVAEDAVRRALGDDADPTRGRRRGGARREGGVAGSPDPHAEPAVLRRRRRGGPRRRRGPADVRGPSPGRLRTFAVAGRSPS